MAKLPANLVKAPLFDNPIRRTAGPDLAVVEAPAPSASEPGPERAAVEAPVALVPPVEVVRAPVEAAPPLTPVRPGPAASSAPPVTTAPEEVITSAQEPEPEEALCHRFSIRLNQPQWEALQTRCFQLRMRGDRINAAELIRRIVDDWMARSTGAASPEAATRKRAP
jgi:hypothetical protein